MIVKPNEMHLLLAWMLKDRFLTFLWTLSYVNMDEQQIYSTKEQWGWAKLRLWCKTTFKIELLKTYLSSNDKNDIFLM